jgi:radical SAM protein with 4Fe4S-binding SPASM domain
VHEKYDELRRGALLAGRVARANIVRPARPLKLNFALTYWCQYKCQTCNIWKRKPVDELTTGEIVTFVRKNPHVSWLDLTGGEIFLRTDIADIFDAITESWDELFVLHFPTNGFLTKQIADLARRIAGSRVPHIIVTVSIDGDEALNDEVRGIKGGFRRQVETVNALRQIEGLRTVVGMTVSRFNVGQVERTFEAVRSECPGLELDDFHVNFAQVSDHYYGNAGSTVVAPAAAAVRELRWYQATRGKGRSAAAWIEGRFLRGLESYLQTGKTPMPCHSLRSSCFVDPWGTVFPCITYTRPLGSLRETGMALEPIWNSAETRTIQGEIWSGSCPQCWTACEAYQSILGNLLRPSHVIANPKPARADRHIPLTRPGD